MATLTAERLVGCVTGGSKEKALPLEFEGVLQEVRTEAPTASAAAKILDRLFIIFFKRGNQSPYFSSESNCSMLAGMSYILRKKGLFSR